MLLVGLGCDEECSAPQEMLKADNVFFVLLRRPRQPITADELESQSRTSRLGGGKHLDGAAEIT